jgi:2-oxoglutarate/2-oxoacid ferredoxin oxidoreductase subunit beta
VPIMQAAFAHRGLALVDVISPCVTFNDHAGSTKSYLYTRKHEARATETDFVPAAREIVATINRQGVTSVTMHDGSVVNFRSVPEGYDPTDRQKVMTYLQERQNSGEIVTGLLFADETVPDLHEMNNTCDAPLGQLPYEKLCPGREALDRLQEEFR